MVLTDIALKNGEDGELGNRDNVGSGTERGYDSSKGENMDDITEVCGG